MRRYTSVDAVTTALLGALGVLGACGGSVSLQNGPAGDDGGTKDNPLNPEATTAVAEDAGRASPQPQDSGTQPPGDSEPVVLPTSCSKHPCVKPQPIVAGGVDTGFDTCPGGTIRRRAIVTCASLLPRAGGGSCMGPDSGLNSCSSDPDCTAHPNGHCELGAVPFSRLPAHCSCEYGCRTDSDCGNNATCLCGNPVGQCVRSECSTHGGCLPGCDCVSPRTYGSFACQTPEDTCFSDTDCLGSPTQWDGGNYVNGSCGYLHGSECAPQSYGKGYGVPDIPPGLSCQPTVGCGTGRPFLVHGAERVAGCVVRPDWRADLTPDLTSCTDSQRSRAAAHWARVGAMEHASIAAFARFTLHLLSLGAPAELVALSQQAMGDETEHARLAYSLASAYSDLPLGPGPLAIRGSLDASTTVEIVATLIREGCIGETLAAIEARDALEHILDPAIRTALEVIARDELRHAELAWKTLAWLLESNRVNRRTARDEVTRALNEMSLSTSNPPDESDDLRTFGVVSSARRAELRERAAQDVIARCIDGLIGRTRKASGRASKVAA